MICTTDERKGRTGAAAGGLDANLALETGNVERNLAKIFREKVKVFGTVQFTQVGPQVRFESGNTIQIILYCLTK